MGPEPMATARTPRTRPRISGRVDETTMMDCMVPKPPMKRRGWRASRRRVGRR